MRLVAGQLAVPVGVFISGHSVIAGVHARRGAGTCEWCLLFVRRLYRLFIAAATGTDAVRNWSSGELLSSQEILSSASGYSIGRFGCK